MFVSVLQPKTTFYLLEWSGSIREYSYIGEEVVFINNIHGKTVQWKTRNQSCSIIKQFKTKA